MTDREKLVELLDYIRYSQDFSCYDLYDMSDAAESIADFLISKGVTVQQYQIIAELEQELAATKRERDAAVDDLSFGVIKCDVCKHGCFFGNDCIGLFGDGGCSFEWRGVCPENTEVE